MFELVAEVLAMGSSGFDAYTARQERLAAEDRNRTIRWVAGAAAATAAATATAYVLTHDDEEPEPGSAAVAPEGIAVEGTGLPVAEEDGEDAWWRPWRRD